LTSRIVIEQAKGAVAQANYVNVDEAFTMIRDYARRTNRRLSDLVHAIVTDPDSLPDFPQSLSRPRVTAPTCGVTWALPSSYTRTTVASFP
jgi:hypothetical protein